jgi:hypothetical protein
MQTAIEMAMRMVNKKMIQKSRRNSRIGALLAAALMLAMISVAVQFAAPASASTANTGAGYQPSTPVLPYLLCGYIKDNGGNPAPNCTITVTNENTTKSATFISDASGFYQYNLANMDSGYRRGESVNITATATSLSGWNATSVEMGWGRWLNVTVTAQGVPEYPMAMVSVTVFLLMTIVLPGARRGRRPRA